MKRVIFALGILLCINSFGQQQVAYKLRVDTFSFKLPYNFKYKLPSALYESVCSTILYTTPDSIEHIISNPSDIIPAPPIHFYKKGKNWVYEGYYTEGAMDGFRNYVPIDGKGAFAIAHHGWEEVEPRPFGDLFVFKNITNNKLKWTKVSDVKSFYHSVGVGDINNDGLFDVLGIHMGSYSTNWGEDPQIYLQNKDSLFVETRQLLDVSNDSSTNGPGAIFVGDLFGDNMPEIVIGDYGFNSLYNKSLSLRFGLRFYVYDKTKGRYVFYGSPKDKGIYLNPDRGSTSFKAADIDNDGDKDLIVAIEGNSYNALQIWINDGVGNFNPGQIIEFPFGQGSLMISNDPINVNGFREFEVGDFNNDGWVDIVLHPQHYGTSFRIDPLDIDKGIKLQSSIWLNNKGNFKMLDQAITIPNISPGFMKGFLINGELKFIGFGTNTSKTFTDTNTIKLYQVNINFCNNLIKPTFNTTKYSFCSGDSLKLTVTNINKGDSLRWYYGSKSDLTNVSNKIFTDTTKLYVTRTDSLGCIISSDTISLVKYAIPSAPTLSRDTESYLNSNSSIGNTWYKDGTALTDTTKKFKPTVPGSYTVKTTQNGCVSSLSTPYYYLVTDIINLSKDEFIKLVPNPFVNQLNFDFVVKGYQRLNLEVFDMSTGTKVASKQNQTAGVPIYLGQLSAGSYVIKVSSTDNKISYQFKMVKL